MMRILLLEDDEVLSESLIELFKDENFHITLVKNGEEAIDATYDKKFDIFLFDINVPLLNGFELLKSLRESGDKTPAIFLTALDDIASLAKGFEVGVDDYIKKPFDFDELLIRIQALLKKRYGTYNNKIKVADFVFFVDKNELYKNNDFISLPPYELKLTHLFFNNLDRTLTKEYICEELQDDKEISFGALRVHINKLRKVGLPIATVKGTGYRLALS